MNFSQIKENAPIKATHYDDELNYYYADGWFLYIWNSSDWNIKDMYPDTSHLKPLY